MRLGVALLVGAAVAGTAPPLDAQFRRGILGGSEEVTLFPVRPPAALLPAGAIRIEVRNATSAPARIADRLSGALERQVLDNDDRLSLDGREPPTTIVATLTEWKRSERSGTRYVSQKRQVGTRQVTDKNGNRRVEPVYEYGRNEPTVINEGAVAVRIQVRPDRSGGVLVDETARHTYFNEELLTQGGPSVETVENELIDQVARAAAGRVSPGRESVRVLLARSDAVDKLNALAATRRWGDWLEALASIRPHREARQDAYRLHNMAVAHEATAYEASELGASLRAIGEAESLAKRALAGRPDEKYFAEAADRIASSAKSYARLAAMYDSAAALPAPRTPAPAPPAPAPPVPAPVTPAPSAPARAPAPVPAPAPAPSMSNADVVTLKTIGLSDENVIAAIEQAPVATFDVSPKGLQALRAAGLSERVIAAMRERMQ